MSIASPWEPWAGDAVSLAPAAWEAAADPTPEVSPAGALPANTRGWESVPGVIRNDGVDSFRVEVNANGQVGGVTLTSSGWAILYPGDASVAVFSDDGQGVDRVAGDNVWTAGPFRWNPACPLPQYFDSNPDSPEGVYDTPIGWLEIQELDGGTSRFLLGPRVGVLRADIPATTTTQLSPDIVVSPHLINVRTSAHETQKVLHDQVGSIRNLTNAIYAVLPDAYDFFTFFSTDKVEEIPGDSSANYHAGKHGTVQRSFTGTGGGSVDNSSKYGSQGRLLGWNLLDTGERGIWGANATHELVHQWAAYMGAGLSDGTGHYAGDSSAGSLVGGVQWVDHGNGTYTMNLEEGGNGAYHASPLDKYLMGLIGPDQLPPTFLQNGNRPGLATGETIYPTDVAATITANHLIAANGFRTPGPAEAQRHFNLAFVAESYQRLLTPTEMTYYDVLAAHYTKVLPPEQPDPYVGYGWQPITRFFGEGVTFSSEVQHGQLALEFSGGSAVENAGAAALTGTVTRPSGDLSAPLTVWLASSDPSELAVPRSVEIPAGQALATFDVAAVDDGLADGTQTPTVTATAYPLVAARAALAVTDDEPVPTRQVRGSAWADLDWDGVRDLREPPLAGWTVFLDVNRNGQLDAGEASTLTDANGDYTFDNPPAGAHDVAQVLPPGWLPTWPEPAPLNPAVAASIHDEPPDGAGDGFNGNTQLVQQSAGSEDRAVVEFDVGSFAGRPVTAAILDFYLEPIVAGGGSSQTWSVYSYTGNGAADLGDFSAQFSEMTSLAFSTSAPVHFTIDATYGFQQFLSGGGSFFGVAFDPHGDVPPTKVYNASLTLRLSGGSPYTVTLGNHEILSGLDFGNWDASPPTVTLTAPPATATATPTVTVTASDNGGLADGTLAAVDADFNQDGDFADPGEAGFAYALLSGGTATFALNAPLPDGAYNLRATVRDAFGTAASSASSPIAVEAAPPRVLSILRTGAALTNADSVTFTVTFSETVTGVGVDDLVATTTGTIQGAAVTAVSGSGEVYTVTVTTGTGDGTLRLDLIDDNSILGDAGKALGGTQPGDGNYALGQTCTVDKTPPAVVSITRYSWDAVTTNEDTVHYIVTLSEPVSGWDNSDFRVVTTGNLTAAMDAVFGFGSPEKLIVYVTTGTGDGDLSIDLLDDDTIVDSAGNPLGGPGLGNGDFVGQCPAFTVLRDPPVVASITLADPNPTRAESVAFVVTFSKDVIGVGTDDFAIVPGGLSGADFTGFQQVLPGDYSTYRVTLATGTGSGTLRLDVVDNNTICDRANNHLGGAGIGNGNFTGPAYAVDRIAPTVEMVPAAPDPGTIAVGHVTIRFSEEVEGFDVAGLTLTRDGGGNLLTASQTLSSADNVTWELGNLSSLTRLPGAYLLTLSAAASGITDLADNPLANDASDAWTANSMVRGRRLFYNNSKFDGNDPAANASDDAAIAPDKQPLLPGGGKAAFKNYTSFSRGINGLMIDVEGLPAATLQAADFAFRRGNDDNPGAWATAANPTTITVRPGAGAGGSDRITLLRPDKAIPNGNWLQVTLLANAHTGLAADDVFYFGSAVGEVGNSTADAKVNSSDVTLIRNNYSGFGTAAIDNPYDFNRDRKVNSADVTICRNEYSGFTPLKLITPPAAMPSYPGTSTARAFDSAVFGAPGADWGPQLWAELAWLDQVQRPSRKPDASTPDATAQAAADRALLYSS